MEETWELKKKDSKKKKQTKQKKKNQEKKNREERKKSGGFKFQKLKRGGVKFHSERDF